MARELVITNGDHAAEALREAGIGTGAGDLFLPWQDVLFEGPVPSTADLPSLSAIRARHLRSRGWAGSRDIEGEFAARDRLVADHAAFDLVTLWFEHDLHDTLQLLQVLDYLAGEKRERTSLRLVHSDRYLRRLTSDELRALAANVRPAGTQRLNAAREAWGSWRQTDPRAWAELGARGRLGLKFLWQAVLVSLGHLPRDPSGLNSPEWHVLRAIEDGQTTPRGAFALFSAWSHRHCGTYMGDWSFFQVLDHLALCERPLIEGLEAAPFRPAKTEADLMAYLDSRLALTAFGKAVLAEREDHAAHNTIDIWLGGTHVTNSNLWRQNLNSQLIPPA